VTEAARVLGISRSKLYELIQRDTIRVVRIDRAVRIPVGEIDRFLASQYAAQGIDVATPDRAA